MSRRSPVVVVAMATFRRPEDLARIMPELVAQIEDLAFESRIVVVDNDPAASARESVTRWLDRGVHYVHEPLVGIAAARNRALDEAADADVVVFVDDDELPRPGWLDALVRSWIAWQCAAVAGPVIAQFVGPADDWVRACGVFDTARRETGSVVAGAASNNLLLDLAQLRDHRLRFDDAFGISGGSDTRLIHQLIKQGGVVRWCAEAEVLDYIPASRSTREWAMRRTFRTGNAWSRVALDLTDTPQQKLLQRLELTLRAAHRGGRGLTRVVRGRWTTDLNLRARGEVDAATAAGVVSGAWGYVFSEYRRAPAPQATGATGSD